MVPIPGISQKHPELWLGPYLADRLKKRLRKGSAKRVWVTLADHYEPLWGNATRRTALARVAAWRDRWPQIADDAPRDALGQPPQYSFFYPQDQYHRDLLDGVAEMVRIGVGDVEVHLHHAHETREGFLAKMAGFCQRLREEHGLLHTRDGKTQFAFIHGNWALDNSLPGGKWCGLNGEIALLRELGCYADFTLPSVPSPAQGRIVNQIYWCTQNPGLRPRSFDHGVAATIGGGRQGDLLMIPGPLGLAFASRLWPRIETGEIASYHMPTAARARLWFDLAPAIGEDLFLKLYTHGAADYNLRPLLDGGLETLFRVLQEEANRRGLALHWATAWQMYQAIEALVCAR